MMNLQVQNIIDTFESTSKSRGARYNDFLAYVYLMFDKKISFCKKNAEMNKYKKMRNSVLSYIFANEREIKSKICK